jgi:hypothetical protein
MFLQGNLQAVFDALYTVGAIDPVLHMDWGTITSEMKSSPQVVYQAMSHLNQCSGDHGKLVNTLNQMDNKLVNYVAMEVARELCEFQERKILH